jgi:hypothetical protein
MNRLMRTRIYGGVGAGRAISPVTRLDRRSKSESVKRIIRKLSVLWVMLFVANVICVGALQSENAVLTILPEAKPTVQHVLPSPNCAE